MISHLGAVITVESVTVLVTTRKPNSYVAGMAVWLGSILEFEGH